MKNLNLSAFIHINRIKREDLNELYFKKHKITKSQISRAENAKEKVSEEYEKKILDVMSIDMSTAKQMLVIKHRDMLTFFNELVCESNLTESQSLKTLKQLITHTGCHFYFVEDYLMEYMYLIHFQIVDEKYLSIKSLLKKLRVSLTKDHLAIYEYCLGLVEKKKSHIQQAITHLEIASQEAQSDLVKGMIFYYLGRVYRRHMELLRSQSCLQKSREYFQQGHIYSRMINVDIAIAKNYIADHSYRDAMKRLEDLLNSREIQYVSTKAIASIYENMLRICVMTSNYEKAEEIIRSVSGEAKMFLEKQSTYFLYRLMLVHHQNMISPQQTDGDRKKCCEEISEICRGIVSGSLGDGIIDELLRYYKNFSGKKTEKIKFLKKAKKIIYLNQDYESMWIWLMIAKKELNTSTEIEQLEKTMYRYLLNY